MGIALETTSLGACCGFWLSQPRQEVRVPPPTSPVLRAYYRTSFTNQVRRNLYRVIIRSYPRDSYLKEDEDGWAERAARGTFWYRTEILSVEDDGLNLVESAHGCVSFLDYSWIRRLNMAGDKYYSDPHIFIRPPAKFFRFIGHAKGADDPGGPDGLSLVRTYGDTELDRFGLLPEFHVFDEMELGRLEIPSKNMRWLTNAEAHGLQTPWRYVTAVHGDIAYRVMNKSDQVLVRIRRRSTNKAAASPPAIEPIRPAFLRQGDYWVLRYRGTTVNIRDTKGLAAIHALLLNQGNSVPLADLGVAPVSVPGSLVDPDDMLGQEESMDLTDTKAIAQCRSELAKIESSLRIAEASGNRAEMSRLQAVKKKIEQYLSSTTNFRGRARRSSNALKRMQDVVAKRLKRALDSIRPKHMDLWKHLNNNIRNQDGVSYRYDPDDRVDWEL